MNKEEDHLSTMMDVSGLWTNEDLNLFGINIQTPIHKKKGDLLFPASNASWGELAIGLSPLLPLGKDGLRVWVEKKDSTLSESQQCKVSSTSPPMSASNLLKNQPSKECMNMEKRPTKVVDTVPYQSTTTRNSATQSSQTRTSFSQNNILQRHALDRPLKKVDNIQQQKKELISDENLSPNIILSQPQKMDEKIVTKKQIISPIPKLNQKEKQPSGKQVLTHPESTFHSSKQQCTAKKIESENPPPLPSLPPQQLILKLFEEKQKRLLAKFQHDSNELLEYISSVMIE
ncbi:hypothetical protein FDP41_012141 [Naegleria fowleri]|uniref:Uncharacterized protein n=1 Tax=Naegleria fowleri TaxID=5763 RepID=A0A6A5C4U7_NAEFO|nr:uncharacterized protein FDP41_012141 [Naegleria fowleri]KAF0981484.1 hypothetical protein FDP41_012141 [Naegleria fowleri]